MIRLISRHHASTHRPASPQAQRLEDRRLLDAGPVNLDVDSVAVVAAPHADDDLDAGLRPDILTQGVPELFITIGDAHARSVRFTDADGTRIAYVSVSDRQLHVYDTIDGQEAPGDTGAGNAYPSLSPDGTKVAFVSNWDIFLADYPLVDLTVSKSADRDEVAGGDALTYTIVITNNGQGCSVANQQFNQLVLCGVGILILIDQ